VLIVHHVFRPDNSRQVLEVGAMQPLHSTALGKVISAFDPVAHSEAVDGERRRFTERTITALDEFEDVLELTRARGWAADVEETWEGLASIAAPIRDRRRMPVGAVGVTGAVERVCEDAAAGAGVVGTAVPPVSASGTAAEVELRPLLVAAVRDCARAVSRDLGARRF
jgi:DNA-binding IclR family transcriptional regulator